MARQGKKRKMTRDPMIALETLLLLALFLGFWRVENLSILDYLILMINPRANPINPPKVKMLNVPKLSLT